MQVVKRKNNKHGHQTVVLYCHCINNNIYRTRTLYKRVRFTDGGVSVT